MPDAARRSKPRAKMYQPLVNPRTKKEIFPASSRAASWAGRHSARRSRSAIGTQLFQFMVFNNPSWDFKTLNFDADMAPSTSGERPHQREDPEPEEVRRARRQADSVSRLGRPADSRRRAARSTTRRAQDDGRREGEGQLSPVHGARHEPLRRRRRHGHLRHADRARALGREEEGAAPDPASHTSPKARSIARARCARIHRSRSYKGSGSTDDAAQLRV